MQLPKAFLVNKHCTVAMVTHEHDIVINCKYAERIQ